MCEGKEKEKEKEKEDFKDAVHNRCDASDKDNKCFDCNIIRLGMMFMKQLQEDNKKLVDERIKNNKQHGFVLKTKDGRKVGNGYCYEVKGDIYLIETDFGNKLKLIFKEMDSLWYLPSIIDTLNSYFLWQENRLKSIK